MNLSEVARYRGVNLSTAKEWLAAGLPGKKTGNRWQFEPAAVDKWLADRDGPAEPENQPHVTLAEARRRKALADAELAEYELAEKKREVVPIEEAVEMLTREFSRVRQKLLALPSKLAPIVVAIKDQASAKEAIEAEITEVLNELSGAPNLPRRRG